MIFKKIHGSLMEILNGINTDKRKFGLSTDKRGYQETSALMIYENRSVPT